MLLVSAIGLLLAEAAAPPVTRARGATVSPIVTTIAGTCRGREITIVYKNDWINRPGGSLLSVKVDGKAVAAGLADVDHAIGGRHIDKASLLPCSEERDFSISVILAIDGLDSKRAQLAPLVAMTITPEAITVERD